MIFLMGAGTWIVTIVDLGPYIPATEEICEDLFLDLNKGSRPVGNPSLNGEQLWIWWIQEARKLSIVEIFWRRLG